MAAIPICCQKNINLIPRAEKLAANDVFCMCKKKKNVVISARNDWVSTACPHFVLIKEVLTIGPAGFPAVIFCVWKSQVLIFEDQLVTDNFRQLTEQQSRSDRNASAAAASCKHQVLALILFCILSFLCIYLLFFCTIDGKSEPRAMFCLFL